MGQALMVAPAEMQPRPRQQIATRATPRTRRAEPAAMAAPVLGFREAIRVLEELAATPARLRPRAHPMPLATVTPQPRVQEVQAALPPLPPAPPPGGPNVTPPAPPAPPVLFAVAKPLPAASGVLVVAVALALPPAPPFAKLPPLPPAPPVALAVLLGSLFGGVVAVASPPGPPSMPGAPSVPATPVTVTVTACDGAGCKVRNKPVAVMKSSRTQTALTEILYRGVVLPLVMEHHAPSQALALI